MNIVLIETSGNQRYIFSTNKLRENVGASELTYQVGTKTVLEALERNYDYSKDTSGNSLRELLLNEKPIENLADKDATEIIVATSGKALLLTQSRIKAEEIIRKITLSALGKMPGLTIHGAISEVKADLTDIHKAIGEVHQRLEINRYQMPPNEQRFLRFPFLTPCTTSGLPASKVFEFKNTNDTYTFSEVTIAKRNALGDAGRKHDYDDNPKKGRLIDLFEKTFDLFLPKNLEEFETAFSSSNWLAVIHADGNGLGEIFTRFDKHLDLKKDEETGNFQTKEEARKYLDTYRKFSIALDICTINATLFALKGLQNLFMKSGIKEVPVIPLILGGDDLTVLCDGRYALKFTKDFLTQFEKETEKISTELIIDGIRIKLDYINEIIGELQGIIPKIAHTAFNNRNEIMDPANRLGICAGVAIIKPHYPFHQAYSLAEELLQSAKKIKYISPALSALDYHVLYDSSATTLEGLRTRFRAFKVARPYIVSDEKYLEAFANDDWIKYRKFSELHTRVTAMLEEEDSRRKLPNSQLHILRERLHSGTEEADAFAKTIAHRYDNPEKNDEPFKKLYVEKEKGKETLFFKALDENGNENKLTHFLDAMEITGFWKGFENGGEK